MHDVTNLDMVALLNEIGEQVVVAMVERGDGEEHDPIMEMLARKVQIIIAITERVKEMTAVEYLEAHQEMCVEHLNIDNFPPSACTGCPLENPHCNCEYFALHYPRQAVEIVRKWKEEQGEAR